MKKTKEKQITIRECDEAYKRALEMYTLFIRQKVESQLGGQVKAARRIMRSRAHLDDCMKGRRKIDTIRSLAWVVASEAVEPSALPAPLCAGLCGRVAVNKT